MQWFQVSDDIYVDAGDDTIVTKFLGRWGRGTGLRYVVRYLREIFTLMVENEPVNLGRGRRTGSRVEGGEPVLCDYG
jgi:hypothetical protein